MVSSQITAIKDYKPPTTLKELRGFLGICSYYRKFVDGFAHIASPLTNLTKGYTGKGKSVKIPWQPEHETAFEALKNAMVNDVVLKFPDFSKPFALYTDASGFAIGGVLSQQTEGGDFRPVTFFSRRLN